MNVAAKYTYFPWLRRGFAAALTTPDTLAGGVAARAELTVRLRLDSGLLDVRGRVHGPGDVTAVTPAAIARTIPAAGADNATPYRFAGVEFTCPDFPWLFTPAAATPEQRLRPWLFPVVVAVGEGVEIFVDPDLPLPQLRIHAPASPLLELPDLADSWAWAHVQVVGNVEPAELESTLRSAPGRFTGRVLCPRRLDPETRYIGALVPAFEAGRLAGLGEDPESEATLRPAWQSGSDAAPAVVLPVYHHWEFRTGPDRDFETLARRLRMRPVPGGVGTEPIEIGAPGGGLPAGPSRTVELGGALGAPGATPAPWPAIHREPFQQALRAALTERTSGEAEHPVLVPPRYGSRYRGTSIPEEGAPPRWLRTLNLDPRHRVAAALGTEVVRRHQEALVASAWRQHDAITRANQLVRQAQLARQAGGALIAKHLAPLTAFTLFQLTAPAHVRVRVADGGSPTSARRALEGRGLARSVLSATFRRATRARGPLVRRSADPVAVLESAGPVPGFDPNPPRPAGTVVLDDVSEQVIGPTAQPLRFGRLTRAAVESMRERPDFLITGEDGPLPELLDPPPFLFAAPIGGGGGGVSTVDHPQASEFRAAAAVRQGALRDILDLARAARRAAAPPPDPDDAEDTRAGLLHAMAPERTAVARLQARVVAEGAPAAAEGAPAAADPLRELSATPRFPQPMAERLVELSPERLLPGMNRLPRDSVTLAETRPAFVCAYLIGLNDEMGRELLWRGYPAERAGTSFHRFWDARGGEGDAGSAIPDIDAWDGEDDLGDHLDAGAPAHLVLLVRSELVRRYPTLSVYAVGADWGPDGEPRPSLRPEDETAPLFRGRLGSDVLYVGLPLTEADVRAGERPGIDPAGMFLVLQEQPSEPHHGLDPPLADESAGIEPPASASALGWSHVTPRSGGATHATLAALGAGAQVAGWGEDAAHMARITLQLPLRVLVHGDALLTGE